MKKARKGAKAAAKKREDSDGSEEDDSHDEKAKKAKKSTKKLAAPKKAGKAGKKAPKKDEESDGSREQGAASEEEPEKKEKKEKRKKKKEEEQKPEDDSKATPAEEFTAALTRWKRSDMDLFSSEAEAMNTKLNDSKVVNNETLKKLCEKIPKEVLQKCALGAAMEGLSETKKDDLKETHKQIIAFALELASQAADFVKSQTPPSASADAAA